MIYKTDSASITSMLCIFNAKALPLFNPSNLVLLGEHNLKSTKIDKEG